jgi:uncharacterized protein (TIGR02001 family)
VASVKTGKGQKMKKFFVAVTMVASLAGGSALAADLKMIGKAPPAPPPPAWDIAFGGVVMSDYNFRGISQSNKGPSAGAYIEPQLTVPFGTLYVGLAGYGINWPSGAGYGFTDPSAEIDFYGGWRNTWGKFSLDLGAIYYYYPKEQFNGFTSDSDFWEVYAKAGYAFTPSLSIGANVFYTPDLLNYSASFAAGNVGAVYASATGKWVLPWTAGALGAFVSGELGHWWISDSNWTAVGLTDPSYTYYNIGLAFTYKALTLDLRYHGTDQSVTDCNNFLIVGAGNPSSNWCNDTFVASIKFDTSVNALK